MKYILFLLAAFLGVLRVFAIPAKPGPIHTQQPDGTPITILMQGDEKSHLILSQDSLVLTTDTEGFYVFADLDKADNVVSTGIREINPESRSSKTIEYLNTIDTRSLIETMDPKGAVPGLMNTRFPYYGENRSLVILVEFEDLEFSIPEPRDYFFRMLNEPGFSDDGGTGSARDFFLSNSSGNFIPQFDVYGPVKLDHEYKYYGENDPYGNDRRPHMMIIHACEKLDDELDFSIYDCNQDGEIDNVYVFYAGYGEADGGGANTIWPHSFDIDEMVFKKYTYDGVMLNHYACSNELQRYDNIPDGIGTFCHEFSHVLGLPDLYATTYSTAYTPGRWDVQDVGAYNNKSRTPPNYSSYERAALGWLEPELLSYDSYELPALGESNFAYIVYAENEDEYFLFENRQQEGFDTYLPGHGMLIWHVDYDYDIWVNNELNNRDNHQYVDLIEADNEQSGQSMPGNSFPGTSNIKEFSPETKPAFKDWNKNDMPYRIYNIEETEEGLIKFISELYENASVESLDVSEGPTVYFDLHGRRIPSPVSGVPVIIRKGTRAKVHFPK